MSVDGVYPELVLQLMLFEAPKQYSITNEVVNEQFHDRELVSEHLVLELHHLRPFLRFVAFRSGRHMGEPPPVFQLVAREPAARALSPL